MTRNEFYETTIFVEDVDYTVVDEPVPAVSSSQQPLGGYSMVLRTVAALAAGAVVVFGPVNMTSAGEPGQRVDRVVIHVNVPAELKKPSVAHVDTPSVYSVAADRFNRSFKPVPLTVSEKLPDPDFDL
jgi:hypothetical protein